MLHCTRGSVRPVRGVKICLFVVWRGIKLSKVLHKCHSGQASKSVTAESFAAPHVFSSMPRRGYRLRCEKWIESDK